MPVVVFPSTRPTRRATGEPAGKLTGRATIAARLFAAALELEVAGLLEADFRRETIFKQRES